MFGIGMPKRRKNSNIGSLGDMPRPTAAQQRLIFRLRTNAQGWNCNEGTFAVCLAFGWIRKNESGQLESV